MVVRVGVLARKGLREREYEAEERPRAAVAERGGINSAVLEDCCVRWNLDDRLVISLMSDAYRPANVVSFAGSCVPRCLREFSGMTLG